jgi:DNA primase
MKRIPEHIVQDIISRTDIVRVVSDYVRLEKKGARWTGLCPFHNEKTPSFGVNPEKGFFYCFGCRKGGDVITFIKEYEKCTYVEALERLADKAGVVLQYEGDDDPQAKKLAEHRDAMLSMHERLAGAFHHLLTVDARGSRALAYARSRKLGDGTIRDFSLGFVPGQRGWLHAFLRKKAYSDAFLLECGLFSKQNLDFCIFSNRLVFPIHDMKGKVVAFGGRLLEGDGPKYINSPETPIFRKHQTLYGLFRAIPAIRSSGSAILCEGYMDVLAFHAAGVHNAVAPLGTAFTEDQATIIKRYAKSLMLGFDTDEAGRKATERAIAISERHGLSVQVLKISGGKDPADLLEKFGSERLKNQLDYTITSDDYILENAKQLAVNIDSGGIVAAFEYLFQFMSGFDSDIRRDSFLEQSAARLGADPMAVRADYLRYRNGERRQPSQPGTEKPDQVAFKANADAGLIAALIANLQLYSEVRSQIGPADFEDPILKDAFIAMEECYRQDELSVSTVVSRLSDEAFKSFILEGIEAGTYASNPEQFMEDGILRLKTKMLELHKKRILARIRDYDQVRDSDELSLNDLLYEKMFLDSELARLKDERLKDERHERA